MSEGLAERLGWTGDDSEDAGPSPVGTPHASQGFELELRSSGIVLRGTLISIAWSRLSIDVAGAFAPSMMQDALGVIGFQEVVVIKDGVSLCSRDITGLEDQSCSVTPDPWPGAGPGRIVVRVTAGRVA